VLATVSLPKNTTAYDNWTLQSATFATAQSFRLSGAVGYTSFDDIHLTGSFKPRLNNINDGAANGIPAASNILTTSATISSKVNPAGSATSAVFQCDSDFYFSNPISSGAQAIGSGTADITSSATVSGLAPNTFYYCRTLATNDAGTSTSYIGSFSTLVTTATTLPATSVTGASAVLNGSVNPAGIATSAFFQYATNPALTDATSTPTQNIGSGTGAVPVQTTISGLGGGVYYYRVVATNANGTYNGALSSVSIGPGYTVASTGSGTFTDISGTGTQIIAGGGQDDAVSDAFNIGFSFRFFGTNYTQFHASSNGLVTFGGVNSNFSNLDFAASGISPDLDAIAALWDDWKTNGGVYAQTTGSAGSRTCIVQWNVNPLSGTNPAVFQIQMFESSGDILMIYQDTATDASGASGGATNGGSATVGIRKAGAPANGRVVMYSYNSATITSGTKVRFTAQPDISVEQPLGVGLVNGFESRDFGSVEPGSSGATLTFTVGNSGDSPLTGLAASISGANPGEFIITPPLAITTLAAGATTDLSVTFKPSGAGPRGATLQIASNDPDESPFDISLTGTGSSTAAPLFAAPGSIPFTSNGYTATGITLGPVTLGFAPVAGQTLTLVNNTSGNAITGTFANLTQGDRLVLAYGGHSYIFTADYSGGDGNDLVLTANTPPTFADRSLSTPFQTAASISFQMLLSQASDADGDTLSVTAAGPSSAPGGSAVLLTGSILYTPPAGFSGTDTFPVTITDAPGDRVTGLVTVTVDAPSPSGGMSQSVRKFNDSISSGASRASTLIGAQTYLITSSVGELAAAAGPAGSLSVGSGFVATLATLLPTNTPPTFAGYSLSTPYQTTAAISLGKLHSRAADADGDAVTVSTAGSATSQGGTVAMQSSAILYTPPVGFSGTDSFPVTVTDARGAYIIGTVTVTVQANTGVGTNSPVLSVLSGGRMGIDFHGIPGRSYEVQRSTDLTTWQTLATVPASSTNGMVSFIDESPPPGSAFYRLR
jgi:hypothetical protein